MWIAYSQKIIPCNCVSGCPVDPIFGTDFKVAKNPKYDIFGDESASRVGKM